MYVTQGIFWDSMVNILQLYKIFPYSGGSLDLGYGLGTIGLGFSLDGDAHWVL